MSIGAALTMSFSYVMIRKAKNTSAVTIVNIFSFFGLCLGALVFTILKLSNVEVHTPKELRDFGLLVANGRVWSRGSKSDGPQPSDRRSGSRFTYEDDRHRTRFRVSGFFPRSKTDSLVQSVEQLSSLVHVSHALSRSILMLDLRCFNVCSSPASGRMHLSTT